MPLTTQDAHPSTVENFCAPGGEPVPTAGPLYPAGAGAGGHRREVGDGCVQNSHSGGYSFETSSEVNSARSASIFVTERGRSVVSRAV